MRRLGVAVLCFVFFGQAVAGCASMSEEQKGATIGAGAGAILGGVAGAVLDKKNPGRGAAIGAAAGAALGGAAGWGVGAYRAKQVKTCEQAAADLNYRPEQGVVTRVDGTSVIPQRARPGDQLTLQAQYVVQVPSHEGQVKVKETRTIFFNNQPVKQMEKETMLACGAYVQQQLITLPMTAAEGPYTVVTTVQPLSVTTARKGQGQATFVVGAEAASATAEARTTALAAPAPAPTAQAVAPAPTPKPSAAPATVTPAPPSRLPVTKVAVPPAPVQPPDPDIVYVKVPLANIRDGAGAGFKVLARVPRGTPLAVLQTGGTEQDRWFKGRLANGQEGWVAASTVD